MTLPYRARRIISLLKGKENIDDFGNKLKFVTIYNIKRDLVIHCNENNLSWYLENI